GPSPACDSPATDDTDDRPGSTELGPSRLYERELMPHVEHRITPDDHIKQLHTDVREGLTHRPKTLPSKWFYDARGSELFEQITALDESSPTRRGRAILTADSAQVADMSKAGTLIELGVGPSDKTHRLLDALRTTGTLRRYVPIDVS